MSIFSTRWIVQCILFYGVPTRHNHSLSFCSAKVPSNTESVPSLLVTRFRFFFKWFFFYKYKPFFFLKNKRSHRVMWLNSVLFVLCFKWTRCLTLFVKSDHLRFISDTEVYSIFLIHKVYILLMIKLLWSVIRLYLCVCFVIASIYTNTSRYTNLHTTFDYKPILTICIKLKKKSMYKSKTYLTKKIFVKNKVVLMKCHQPVSNI